MKRFPAALALVTLAAAAAGWLALRGWTAGQRGAASHQTTGATPEERAVAELAAPASLPAEAEGAPAPDRFEVAATSVESAQDEVVVVDAGGSPVAGVPWALFREAEVLASGMTDVQGAARFAQRQGEAQLAVAPRRHPPQVFAVDLALERRRVTLAAGAAVAGVVLVDGFAPREPLALSLWSADEQPIVPDVLPAAVWTAFGGPLPEELATKTGAEGAFRFDGLPEGFAGTLYWAGPFYLAGAGSSEDPAQSDHAFVDGGGIDVQAASDGLVVALESAPTITGRVVAPETGAPVAEARVTASWSAAAVDMPAEQDGSFRISMRGELPDLITVMVADPNRSGRRRYQFELPQGARAHDLGLLAILPTRRVVFEVRDTSGGAVQGAVTSALPVQNDDHAEAETDAQGRGELDVLLDARALRVAALGFQTAEVPLPDGAEPLAIVLRAGTVLEVRLTRAPDLGVLLSGSEPPFAKDGQPSWEPDPPVWSPTWSPDDEDGFALFRGAQDGTYVLGGVRPGVPLHLAVVDALWTPIVDQVVAALSDGERRVLELPVPRPKGALAGRVVSSYGAPIEGAEVKVGRVGSDRLTTLFTDAEGRFRIAGLATDVVRVVVEESSHGLLMLDAQPVVEEPPLELVLDAGRPLRVRVHGPDGTPAPESRAVAELGHPTRTQYVPWIEPGVHVSDHAPRQALTLGVTAGGHLFERLLAAGSAAEEVDVEIPAWQACTVRVSGPRDRRLCVELASPDIPPERRLQRFLGAAGDEARFEVVFPGRYEARAVAWIDGKEERLSEPVVLEVTADNPSSVTLELREP